MTIITLYLQDDLIEQCKKLAKKQKITLNEFIVKAITEFINEQEAKKCQTDSTLNNKS
jgi:predicted transcriptional regulator